MYILKLYIIYKFQLMNQTRSLAYTPMMYVLTPLQVEISKHGKDGTLSKQKQLQRLIQADLSRV